MIMQCRFCKFWEQTKIGVCSQKMQTVDGGFVNVQTLSNYGCVTCEDDKKKYKVEFWQDEKGKIHINGEYSKEYLKRVIAEIEKTIKEGF